jgi:hypothetical protein
MLVTLGTGLLPTSDRNGMIALASQLPAGVRVYQAEWDQTEDVPQTDIFIGHSFFARRMMQEMAKGYSIRYAAFIDPVFDWFPVWVWNYWKAFIVPPNVMKADSFQRAWPLVPPSGTIKNENAQYRNFKNISMDHADAPKNTFVVSTILQSIQEVL